MKPSLENKDEETAFGEDDPALRKIDPSDMIVLVPALAIEFGPLINALYQKGVRDFFVFSLDRGLRYDFVEKIKVNSPDVKIVFLDDLDTSKEHPSFTFCLPSIRGVPVDPDVLRFLSEERVPTIPLSQVL